MSYYSMGNFDGEIFLSKKHKPTKLISLIALLLIVNTAKAEEEANAALAEQRREQQSQASQVNIQYDLLKENEWSIDQTATYSHIGSNKVFFDGVALLPILVLGPVGVQRIQRDILTYNVAIQYGFTPRIQGELRIPYRYIELRNEPTTNTEEYNFDKSHGLSDVSMTVTYQARPETIESALLLGLTVKSNTGDPHFDDEKQALPMGTGFISLTGSALWKKTLDPVVLYGGVNYTHSIKRSGIKVRSIDPNDGAIIYQKISITPGSTFGYNLGMGVAFNSDLSFSIQYNQSISQASSTDGERTPNSYINAAQLRNSIYYLTDKDTGLETSVALGLTDDAPDTQVSFRWIKSF